MDLVMELFHNKDTRSICVILSFTISWGFLLSFEIE